MDQGRKTNWYWRTARGARLLPAVLALSVIFLRPRAAEIMMFAAASLSDAVREIASEYLEKSGDKIVFNFASSSTLARQIAEGARADLFFSADEEKMDELEKKGLIRKETRSSLLSNSLVIVVPTDSSLGIKTAGDLRKAKRIALAETGSVPAGIYARKYLEQARLWAELEKRVIPTENVRASLAAVESGNADAAVVYKTDAAISHKVKVAYEVPRQAAPRISYPVAVLTEARSAKPAEKFLEYLRSPEGRKKFVRFGFIVLPIAGERNGNG